MTQTPSEASCMKLLEPKGNFNLYRLSIVDSSESESVGCSILFIVYVALAGNFKLFSHCPFLKKWF